MPAGKRRDQTTAEIFGSYDEKDLRAMPKTFVPKDREDESRPFRAIYSYIAIYRLMRYESHGEEL